MVVSVHPIRRVRRLRRAGVFASLMLLLTDRWIDRLDIDGFLTALGATLLISLFSTVAQMIVLRGKR